MGWPSCTLLSKNFLDSCPFSTIFHPSSQFSLRAFCLSFIFSLLARFSDSVILRLVESFLRFVGIETRASMSMQNASSDFFFRKSSRSDVFSCSLLSALILPCFFVHLFANLFVHLL